MRGYAIAIVSACKAEAINNDLEEHNAVRPLYSFRSNQRTVSFFISKMENVKN